MSTDLATMQFPIAKHAEDESNWGDVVTAASYLPYISLYGGNSTPCKEGKIGIGRYGIVRQKDAIEDLTQEFDSLPLGWRYKAMQISDGNILVTYDPKSQLFLMLKDRAAQKDSGAMYGIEFLLWVPRLPAKCYATFFCNNKTGRREAPNIRTFCPVDAQPEKGIDGHGPLPMTLRATLIKANTYVWHGPVATPCAVKFEVPPYEEMLAQALKFANPEESAVEAAPPAATRDR